VPEYEVLGLEGLGDREDLKDLEAEPDQMVRHHRHQVLDSAPEHQSRRAFQREWKDEVKAHSQKASHHRWNHQGELEGPGGGGRKEPVGKKVDCGVNGSGV
jgi:hypothetical protein